MQYKVKATRKGKIYGPKSLLLSTRNKYMDRSNHVALIINPPTSILHSLSADFKSVQWQWKGDNSFVSSSTSNSFHLFFASVATAIEYLMLHTSWSRTNLNHMKRPCKQGSIIVFDSKEYIFPGGVVAHIQMCMNAWLLSATREEELAMAKEIFANYAWYCSFNSETYYSLCWQRTMPPKTWIISQETLVNI